MTTEANDNPRMYRALRVLEKKAPPLLYGHEPFWRAPITPPSRKPHIPSWNWKNPQYNAATADLAEHVTLDSNGAFLAAAGSVEVAHGQLKCLDVELDAFSLNPRAIWPGYYLIDNFRWAFGGTIVSPLGNTVPLKVTDRVWVAAPTLVLLLELLAEGVIGDVVITDAWVSERRCNFREWTRKLKVARNGLLDNIAKADDDEAIAAAQLRYRAFKEGYGAAFSMMLTGEQCYTRRPDWAHTVYAQHAATSWRKAWRFSAGGPLLAMGNTDTLTIFRDDLKKAVVSAKPPLKLDPSGRQLGYFKEAPDEPEQLPENYDLIMSDDTFEDVL